MTPEAGRRPRLPVALCALAALAGHAALLGWPDGGAPRGAGSHVATAAQHALQVSLRTSIEMPLPSPPAGAAEAAPQQAASTAPDPERKPPAPAASTEPLFADGLPEVRLPDALLPPDGVRLRLFVRVDGEGRVRQITSALYPADASDGFQLLSERALGQARLVPTGEDRQHCLQLDFREGSLAPTWSWRPDAGPAPCLTSQAPAAKPLPAP